MTKEEIDSFTQKAKWVDGKVEHIADEDAQTYGYDIYEYRGEFYLVLTNNGEPVSAFDYETLKSTNDYSPEKVTRHTRMVEEVYYKDEDGVEIN